jgi:hypothetical protein
LGHPRLPASPCSQTAPGPEPLPLRGTAFQNHSAGFPLLEKSDRQPGELTVLQLPLKNLLLTGFTIGQSEIRDDDDRPIKSNFQGYSRHDMEFTEVDAGPDRQQFDPSQCARISPQLVKPPDEDTSGERVPLFRFVIQPTFRSRLTSPNPTPSRYPEYRNRSRCPPEAFV